MARNDSKTPRTVQDLMRRFDFGAILGLKKNFEIQKKNLYKIENELNNMLNSFIINLSDVLENQSDVSLWFYNYLPTTSNEPYSNWVNKQEHDGDLFYDQSTGRVYQYKYTSDSWIENTDESLISAMATTNVGIDTTTDHERKIYFNQPTPPYESGDWWIKNDGTLFVCQLSKTTGDYEDDDFINSANFVATVAVKNNNEITVLKGTVMKISESYVSVEDLATGGRTVIDGGNIKTGTIDANLVTIANDNVILDEYKTKQGEDDLIPEHLKLNGKTLNDLSAATLLDPTIADGDSQFIKGLGYNAKKDTLTARSGLTSKNEFEGYIDIAEKLYNNAISEMAKGNYQISPIFISENNNACTYCDMKEICHKRDSFYREIVEEEGEEDGKQNLQ